MFENRIDAAILLAEKLEKYKHHDGIVLAIPRGGVPLGRVVADTLTLPLEIVLSKKIGHPWHKEYAIGAVSLEGRIINKDIKVAEAYIDAETIRIQKLLREQYNWYYTNRKPTDFKNKTLIIVDDGIATGYTMLSTVELLKQARPEKIVVAVPVISSHAFKNLSASPYVDEIVYVIKDDNFRAVGQYYKNFNQVSDQEVVNLISVGQGLSE